MLTLQEKASKAKLPYGWVNPTEDFFNGDASPQSTQSGCGDSSHLRLLLSPRGRKKKDYIGNGREFKLTDEEHYFYGRLYPVFKDKNGTKAYLEGMVILEMQNISDYQSAIPWTMNADEITHYYDLGISLIRFSTPQDAITAYQIIDKAKGQEIVYMGVSLIEEQHWVYPKSP